MKKPILYIATALLSLFSSCGNVLDGINAFSIDDDLEFGAAYDEQIKQANEHNILSPTQAPKTYKMVNGIVSQILKSGEIEYRDEFAWDVTIINDDSVINAFATPGGYIYVYTGLIKYLEREDELAGVLGHEMAHADSRHSTQQMTKAYGLKLALSLFLNDNGILNDIASGLIGLKFSRSDETEADMKSVEYLYKTKYDPRGVGHFFKKLEDEESTLGPMVFLSTHPNPENRVQKINEHWKQLGGEIRKTDQQAYKEVIQEIKQIQGAAENAPEKGS